MKCLSKDAHPAISRHFAGAVTLLMGFVCLAPAFEAHGQATRGSAAIVVSEEWHVDAGADASIAVDVKTGNALASQLLLLIRGVPPAISLSPGRLFESGVWALRISDLPKLKIAAGENAAGGSELSLSLVGVDGTVLAQRYARLVIDPPHSGAEAGEASATHKDTAPTVAPITADTPSPVRDQTASLPPVPTTVEATEEVLQLMARGDENLKTGKISVARKFYERAADKGWAPAALALGKTYDPQELARIGVIGGIRPDLDLARTWYERARDMGLVEASDRLQRIGNR